jgi:hypothetical protein
MSQELINLIQQAARLFPEEQLQLIAHLTQTLSHYDIQPKPRHNVMEFSGSIPNLLNGMDAQEYVTQMRRGEFPDLKIADQSQHPA